MRSSYKLQNRTIEGCIKEIQPLWIKPSPDRYNAFKIGLYHAVMFYHKAIYDVGYNIVGHEWKCMITFGHGVNGTGFGITQRKAMQAALDNMFEKGCRICSDADVVQIGESFESLHSKNGEVIKNYWWNEFKGLDRSAKPQKVVRKKKPMIYTAKKGKQATKVVRKGSKAS